MPGFRMTASFRRLDEALLTLEGPVGPAETGQVVTILQALLDAGSRHVVVDMTAAQPTGPGLAAHLDGVRRRLAGQGGWLIVDPPGAASEKPVASGDADDDHAPDDEGQLAELFGIYRRVTAPPRAPLRACGC
jgi:hypothetical protein